MLQWINNVSLVIQKIAVKVAVAVAVFFCFLTVLQPVVVYAQAVPSGKSTITEGVAVIKEPLGLPADDIRIIIARIIRIALGLLGIIFVGIILYAGFLWMTAGGNEEQIEDAKKVLKNGIIGLIIILSAYSIVLFVMHLLGFDGNPGGSVSVSTNPPTEDNFQGSGALGMIIKDHYPARDQVDVPRNTKIVITFRKPIDPSSIGKGLNVTDKGQTKTFFGVCTNIGATMDWIKDCDHLILDNDHISISAIIQQDGKKVWQPISGAAFLASDEGGGKVTTIVLRPDVPLGSEKEKIGYVVHIGNAIKLADQKTGIFDDKSAGNNFYEWQFISDTKLDLAPPHVVSVFPGNKVTEKKNSVIQVTFNKAMDPTVIQGVFNIVPPPADYYVVNGNAVYLRSGKSSKPEGNFTLVNGYRTLEFTPSTVCGVNACGGKVYCLPVCDDKKGGQCAKDADGVEFDSHEMVLKAGQTFSGTLFEAIPFSGFMDLSGNALDGNNDGKVNPVSQENFSFNNQKKYDNYWWQFNILNMLDISAPFVKQVAPGVDAPGIRANDEWSMLFSKTMRVQPMYDGISIDELPVPTIPLWRVPMIDFKDDQTTYTKMSHGPFLDAGRRYYYPGVDSRLEDVHFNCLYPGLGPKGWDQSSKVKASPVCDGADKVKCCLAESSSKPKSFCCNGVVNETLKGEDAACLKDLKSKSPL